MGQMLRLKILAGITTFLAMAYILGSQPCYSRTGTYESSGCLLSDCNLCRCCKHLYGINGKTLFFLAPGMGVNALFTYTIVGQMGLSPEGALACVFVSGIIFVIITVTNICRMIINAIPAQLKLAIGAGIGFFVAFVGLKNAGIVVASESTFVSLGNFKNPTVLLALFGIIITLVLLVKNKPAAVFYGLIITAVVGVVFGSFFGLKGMPQLPTKLVSVNFDFSLVGAFARGFNEMFTHPQCIVAIFSLLFVDFFDTAGTLVAVASKADLIDENGELVNVERALLADAVGTVFGSMIGTSTVTSFVESTSGVGVGGRTGLTACTTGICFLLTVFFYPVLSMITDAVTAPALVIVGILMASQLKDIKWDNLIFAASGFVTIIFMILGYSISNGIALGFIVYVISMIATGQAKDINKMVWVLFLLFIAYFAFLI